MTDEDEGRKELRRGSGSVEAPGGPGETGGDQAERILISVVSSHAETGERER